MQPAERRAKKVEEGLRLTGLTPRESIEVGADLTDFGRQLAEAARRARD